jgi:hypothetical protein
MTHLRCLLWGFDVNTRTLTGLNALMAAAKGNHLEVLKYLLNPPRAADSDESITCIPLAPISDADAGFLLVTAAANAALDDELGMLTRILLLGVDVNAKDEVTGMTGLHGVSASVCVCVCVCLSICLVRYYPYTIPL